MKRIWIIIMVILLLPFPVKAFSSSATSTVLMDMDSHRVLYSNNRNQVRSVASISKIMTAILAVESGKLEEEVEIGEEILKAYGSAIYIKVGEHMKLKDLVYGLMLRSGNDAALAIANYVGGSVERFVLMMNEKAKEIGMSNTTFHNPSGLDETDKGNLSTAYDMALLTSYAMKNAEYKEIVKTKKHSVKTDCNYYIWHNKNKMLSIYPYSTGGKTGYTEIAKRTLVSTASKNGLNLVAVTLNDGNDWNDHKNLMEEAYETYTNYPILKKGEIIIDEETHYLNETLYIKNDVTYPIKETEKNMISIKYELEKKKDYNNHDSIGKVMIYFGDELIKEEPVYIQKAKEKKEPFLKKLKKWFDSLW